MIITLNGRDVNVSSLECEGATWDDYPDLVDTFYSSGYYNDGGALSDEDLEILDGAYPSLLYDLAIESLQGDY